MRNSNLEASGTSLGCAVTRQITVAEEIVSYAHELAEKADYLSGKAHDKLSPIMNQCSPAQDIGKQVPREYPPLFESIRIALGSIDKSLESISEALSRTEL